MKKILLIGKMLTNAPAADELVIKNAEYFAAPDLQEVKQIFKKNNNAINIVIMGGGIELEKRLEIARYVFNTSNITTVHMKDRATGPEGFVPFINNLLTGLLHDN